MRTIFEACEPRPEVLADELREEIFAARLRDVVEGRADPVYQDPRIFFDNTYPTAGIKLLLEEALGRLTATRSANNAIIRLETAFGGGKTHNLIALYHAACGYECPFIPAVLIPQPGDIQIAGVVGSDLDPSNGTEHPDITTYTLWGELAYQIRGADGYSLVAQSDLDKTAPGTSVLERLIGDLPTLIMIDEVARHLRAAKTIPITGGSNLAEQTIAFLMSLFEFAASKRQVVVVFTMADPSDAFGRETEELAQELAEMKRISARQERVITPAAETEIAAIVTHRLFRSVDHNAARETASVYSDVYRQCVDRGANIPQRALRAEYAQEIAFYYPLHPELLNTLNRKTSTIPNFQRTRGALRLLAMVVRELWTYQPNDVYLIHLHDINLVVDEIANDLTSRLERPRFKQVIEADIVSSLEGSPAHAQVLDREMGAPYPYTRRVATTAFLHSLTQGVASGVDPADLVLATITPGDDPAVLLKAANNLVEKGWFFEYDGHRYRFKTEPSINKIINDEMGMVGVVSSKAELDRRIKLIWKKGYFTPVFFPSEPGDVDDDAEAPKLVVIHYDAAMVAADEEEPPELVAHIFNYAGAQEGYREFRNNLMFLVADDHQVGNMIEQVRRYLAIQRIISDSDRMAEFLPEQRSELKKRAEAAELDMRVAITRAYRWLYYPSAEAPEAHSRLARTQLTPQEQGDVARDQGEVILRVLKDLEKVQTQESTTLSAQYVSAKAWDLGQEKITTEDLRKMFARKLNLRMMLDINQLKKTIRNGIEQGVWVYYDAREQMGYNQYSLPPAIEISEDAILYRPAVYANLGWPIKGLEPQPPSPSPSPEGDVSFTVIPRPPLPLRGEGAPGQAFQALRDACRDQKIKWLRCIRIAIQGDGPYGANEVRALGLSIPQLGKAAFWIEQRLAAEFGDGEQLLVKFAGGWDCYKRLKQVPESFGQEAVKFHASTTLRMDFPGGLDVYGGQFQTIMDVFSQFQFGYMIVEAEPFEDSV